MSEETEPRQFTYDAFATYATDPDRDLVRDIEDFIESLHRDRPLSNQFREKLAICVDGQDFRIPRPEAANPKTLEQIMRDVVRTCQATSRCLLVFSGSSTASHPWINAEINWWREQPGFGPIFFVLTHGQVSENAGRKLGDDAGQKNSVSDSLPNALALDRAGLSELWFDLRGHYVRAGWRRFRRSLLDRKLSAESSNWNKVRIYSEERFRLATQILALRLEKDLSKEDVLPKWKAAWRLKQRLRRVQLGIGVVLLFVAAMIADRVIEGQRIEELTTVAQAAVNDQEYERAIKTAIQGLPVDGGFFWRRGWSDAAVKKLLAILAGASQMSAYVGQLKSDEYEGSIENRARMPLRNAEFDPSGTKIVTASNAGSVTIWDRLSREKLLTCSQDKVFPGYAVNPGSTTWVRDARFGETAETVLSVGRYGAWIWSPTCKTCAGQNGAACEPKARMLGHSADVRTGMFSPDWTKVVTTSDDETVREWNAASGSEIAKLELPESNLPKGYRYTTGAEYSLDGKSIVVGRRDGLIAVLDAQTRQVQQILQNSGDAVWSVHFDRSAQRVLSSSGNGYVVIWDIRSGKPVSFFRQASGVGKSVFSPDQRYILTTSLDNVARIWDATTLEQVFALKGHARSLTSASFSPDGKQIVTTSDDGTARIWNIGISILPSVVTATSGANKSSAISNDGRKLAVGTSDGHVAVYVFVPPNELTPGPAFRVGAAAITSVSFGRDSDTLVVAADDG